MLEIINSLDLFFEDCTREISIREYSRIKKIAPVTAGKILRNLVEEGLLNKREDRGYILFRINSFSFEGKKLAIIYWKNKLKELIDEINKFYNCPTIILFGSIEKCENNLGSDIDLVIISEKTTEFNKISEFEKKLKREIQLFVVGSIKDLKNKNLINNVLNGTKLEGSVEWI